MALSGTFEELGFAELLEVLTRIARSEDRLAVVEDRSAEIDRRLRGADELLEVQQSEAAQVDHEQHQLEEGLRNLLAERDRLMGLLREALDRHQRGTETLRVAMDRDSSASERSTAWSSSPICCSSSSKPRSLARNPSSSLSRASLVSWREARSLRS